MTHKQRVDGKKLHEQWIEGGRETRKKTKKQVFSKPPKWQVVQLSS